MGARLRIVLGIAVVLVAARALPAWAGDAPKESLEEAYYLAEKIKDENIRSIVVNMEHTAFDQGLSQALADHLKAPCYTLAEFKADALYHTVRKEMEK